MNVNEYPATREHVSNDGRDLYVQMEETRPCLDFEASYNLSKAVQASRRRPQPEK